ncbi:conserved protein, unknown function [Plasmodium vinckei vinckei]|uniref:Ribosome quality control complex subunit 2 n=1 Tax=Plasmodium vinckei vinckei TaxID=54757 RepID=A0A081ICL0_PLAVN|nr:conserved protein, unknown function [Plasmodium vinckei vinckei]KEG01418.1 hypothetical protein YYE_03514 [Plasmodium vinckei vinckei]VEV55396.1 conserved protein, unknown function [Plasmodium vinckei vinckei]
MGKQRLTALDIRAIITSCKKTIIGSVVTNIYNISNKIYVLKCSKKEQKYFLLLEAEKRVHITEWMREKNVMPSGFTMKLRKHLRSRKITNISQLGGDRVVDIQFGYDDNIYHLIVELYIAGNIVLTNNDYKIIFILKSNDDKKKLKINDIYNVEEHNSVILYKYLDIINNENIKKSIKEILMIHNQPEIDDPNEVNTTNETSNIINGKMIEKNMTKSGNVNLLNSEKNDNVKVKKKSGSQNIKNSSNSRKGRGETTFGDSNKIFNDKNKNDDIQNDNKKNKKAKKIKTLSELGSKLILFAHNDLIMHSLIEWNYNPNDPVEKYDIDTLTEIFYKVINECMKIFNMMSNEESVINGYGFVPIDGKLSISNKNKKEENGKKNENSILGTEINKDNNSVSENKLENDRLFVEFSPVLLKNHINKINEKKIEVIKFNDFNMCVDTYFSKMELTKYDKHQEMNKRKNALTKIDKIKLDHERRIEALEKEISILKKKILLIQANDGFVEEAIKLMRAAISTSANWEKIWDHVKLFKRRNHPVALKIMSVNFSNCEIELLLDEDNEKESSSDNSSEEKGMEEKNKGCTVTINLNNSVYGNIEDYEKLRKKAEEKIRKIKMSTNVAIKKVEKKKKDKDTKQKSKYKSVFQIQKLRKIFWFEKFNWFLSSENYLVISGRDALQNEILFRRYFQNNDIYVHADIHGAASCIIKNPYKDIPIPEKTLAEAGQLAMCRSSAWNNKVITSAWWVYYHQVSKTAPTGEYIKTGAFVIRGKKNYLPYAKLEMGLSIIFQVNKKVNDNNKEDALNDDKENDEIVHTGSDNENGGNGGKVAATGNVDKMTATGNVDKMTTTGNNIDCVNHMNNCKDSGIINENNVMEKGIGIDSRGTCKYYLRKKHNKKYTRNKYIKLILKSLNRIDLLNVYKKNMISKLGTSDKYRNEIISILCKLCFFNLCINTKNDEIKSFFEFLYKIKNHDNIQCYICKAFKKNYKIALSGILKLFRWLFLYFDSSNKFKGTCLGGIFYNKCLKSFDIAIKKLMNDSISFYFVHKMFLLKSYDKKIGEWCKDEFNIFFEINKNNNFIKNEKYLSYNNNGDTLVCVMRNQTNEEIKLDLMIEKDYVFDNKIMKRCFTPCEVYGLPPVAFKDDDISDDESKKSKDGGSSNKVAFNLGDNDKEDEQKKHISFANVESSIKIERPTRTRKPTGFVKMDVKKLLEEIDNEEEEEEEDDNHNELKREDMKVTFDEQKKVPVEKKGVAFNLENNSVYNKSSTLNIPRPTRTRKPTGFVKADLSKLLEEIDNEEEGEADGSSQKGALNSNSSTTNIRKKSVSFSSEDERIYIERPITSGIPPRPIRTRKPTGFVKMDISKLLEEIDNEEESDKNEKDEDEKGDDTKKVKFSEGVEKNMNDENVKFSRPVRTRKPTGFVKMDVKKLLEEIDNEEEEDENSSKGKDAYVENSDNSKEEDESEKLEEEEESENSEEEEESENSEEEEESENSEEEEESENSEEEEESENSEEEDESENSEDEGSGENSGYGKTDYKGNIGRVNESNSNKKGSNETKKEGRFNDKIVKNENKKSTVHLLRGARTKKKRMKKKYREQDDDDEERQLYMKIIGSRKMKHETEKEKKEQEEKKIEKEENKYNKRPNEIKANYEEINEDEMNMKLSELNKLTFTPKEDDVITCAIPMCAPYSAIQNHKYKVKLVPGNEKKGKIAKSCIAHFLKCSTSDIEKKFINGISMDDLGNCIITNSTADILSSKCR